MTVVAPLNVATLSHPFVMIDNVTEPPTPEDLEQLARSVAMSGVPGDRGRPSAQACQRDF